MDKQLVNGSAPGLTHYIDRPNTAPGLYPTICSISSPLHILFFFNPKLGSTWFIYSSNIEKGNIFMKLVSNLLYT